MNPKLKTRLITIEEKKKKTVNTTLNMNGYSPVADKTKILALFYRALTEKLNI